TAGVDFDRFWQSAIAGLALAVRPAVSIAVTPAAIPLGQSARVRVRLRSPGGIAASRPVTVSATLASGEPIRLWPEAEVGAFSGTLTPSRTGVDRLDVVATNGNRTERGSIRFVTGDYTRPVDDPIVPLSALSASRGGIDVAPNELPALERWLRQTIAAKTTPVQRHPMRSAWWIVPFAGCLSVEWWMRRRRGLH